MESEFEKIAEEAIRKAEKVKCSKREFREGLQTIVDALQVRLDCEPETGDE